MEEPLATYTTYDGSEYSVLERPEGPEGALIMRFRLRTEAGSPPPHVHPATVEVFEVFEVLEGEFEVLVNKVWQTVRAGESATVEPGVRRNRSGADVVVRNVHDPHHDFEAYIRSIAKASQEMRATSPNSPKAAIQMALLWERHDDLIQPADPPMKVAFPLLRGLGRLARVTPPE